MKVILPSNRKIIASLFFLLAVLVGFYGVALYYLSLKYPISAVYIAYNLDSPEVTKVFRVEDAKKAGYSEEEITKELTKRNTVKFNRYKNNIILIELTIFLVVMFIAIGIMVLNPRSEKK